MYLYIYIYINISAMTTVIVDDIGDHRKKSRGCFDTLTAAVIHLPASSTGFPRFLTAPRPSPAVPAASRTSYWSPFVTTRSP